MIQSILDKSAGFFSMLFFSINHYIYCKKNDVSFTLDTSNWLYKYKDGWIDYFQDINFKGNNDDGKIKIVKHNELLYDYNIQEYRDTILNNYFLYNDKIKKLIEERKIEIGLINQGTYDSIYIRHGDKLCAESKYYPTEIYMNILLQKNPNCKRLFIQTDDYNCVLDVQKYIQENKKDIEIFTICDLNTKGIIAYETELELKFDNCIIQKDEKHKEYFEKVIEDLQKTKPINKMNNEEIFQHTLDLLVGLDIVLNSNYCILDKQSNVSKFICIAHNNYKNVFDIRYPNENIEMYWTMCPALW